MPPPQAELTIEQALSIQHSQLQEWKDKLTTPCFEALQAEANRRNEAGYSDALSVWRGMDLIQFVYNWKPQ
jgi:hypothetical protein